MLITPQNQKGQRDGKKKHLSISNPKTQRNQLVLMCCFYAYIHAHTHRERNFFSFTITILFPLIM